MKNHVIWDHITGSNKAKNASDTEKLRLVIGNICCSLKMAADEGVDLSNMTKEEINDKIEETEADPEDMYVEM